MAKLHQGDRLLLPIKVKMGTDYITPLNCDDLRIQVEDILKSYSAGELTYSSNTWYFPLTSKQTRDRENPYTDVQVSIKQGTTITHSDIQQIEIAKSIIEEEW